MDLNNFRNWAYILKLYLLEINVSIFFFLKQYKNEFVMSFLYQVSWSFFPEFCHFDTEINIKILKKKCFPFLIFGDVISDC